MTGEDDIARFDSRRYNEAVSWRIILAGKMYVAWLKVCCDTDSRELFIQHYTVQAECSYVQESYSSTFVEQCNLRLECNFWTRVFNFRFFIYFAKHETIRKPRLFRENFAKQKYAKFRFVSFRTTKLEAKFRFVSQKFSFVSRKFCLVLYRKRNSSENIASFPRSPA